MIEIHGLTKRQVRVLDEMWKRPSLQEVNSWISEQDYDTFVMARCLQTMVNMQVNEDIYLTLDNVPEDDWDRAQLNKSWRDITSFFKMR